MVGSSVGPYQLLEELGSGGMATVFRARQESMGRDVAIKVIHQAISLDHVATERFQREAQVIARLEHPHILPVYDYDGTHAPPYIVMRYMPTGTLKDIMLRAKLPLEDIAHVYGQVGSALDYAHRRGIIHRDVKPSNMMIDQDGNAFLTDFGIARFAESGGEDLTGTGMAVGTPGYMAPEQTLGTEVDGRVDIYAMGVMLFELLTGRAPFLGDTPMAVLLKHINDPVPAPSQIDPSISPALDIIVMRALAKDPDDRYQTVTDMAQDLFGLLQTPVSRPLLLADVAIETITDLQIQREQVAGSTGATFGTVSPTQADTVVVTDEQAQAGTTNRYVMIGGLIAVVIVIAAIIGFLVLGGGGDDVEATQTAEAQVIAQNQTRTAATQTAIVVAAQGSEAPTEEVVADSPTPTDSPSPTLTNTPSRTPTDTSTATPSDTPTATPTDTPTSTPTATFTATNTPSDARAVVTVVQGLIFAEPSTRSEQLTIVPQGANLLVMGETGDGLWYQVEFLGDVGWILADQIDVTGNLDTIVVVVPSETPTPTNTPTSTSTPTSTNTPTSTPTDTVTPTSTPTWTFTPTSTFTPTLTPTPTFTLIPTQPPITNTPVPSPSPIPAGAMPFLADMESGNPLSNWLYDPNQWQVRTDGGNTALFGTTGFESSMTILGRDVPEWVEPGEDDLLLSFRVNLLENNSGARLIFKFEPSNGYYVMEMLSGLIIFKRGQPGVAPERGSERELARVSGAQVIPGRWYEFTIWTEGGRTYIYQGRQLIISTNDSGLPLAPGGILLQTFSSAANPVGWDDFIIQRPELASDHFEGASFPTTWERNSQQNVTLAVEGNGDQVIQLENAAIVQPVTPPLEDFIIIGRLNNTAGGFEMFVRESSQGVLELDWDAGHVEVIQRNSAGEPVFSQTLRNYYGRGRYKEFVMTLVGERVTIYSGGDIILEEDLVGLPTAGFVRFETQDGDGLRIDDFLIAETALSGTADASFALEILGELENRSFRELLWDWSEDFSDPFRTRGWWAGDLEGDPGEYFLDETVPPGQDHRRYYILHGGDIGAWRLFNREVDSTLNVFGFGRDAANFRDSVDIYVRIFMRIPPEAPVGTEAWVGVRTEETASGGLTQYKVAFIKNEAGQTQIAIGPDLPTDRTPIYEDVLPQTDWVEIEIITLDDQMAFFADGLLLTAIDDVELLAGSLAVGVEPGGIGHFDDLIVRDTSVNE